MIRAVVLSAAASLIHMLMTPVYFDQWLGYGAFFFSVSFAQLLYATALAVSPTTRFELWAGIIGNGAIIVLWLVTRTLGIPLFGPEAGQVQPVGLPDLLATAIELALIAHLVALLPRVPELKRQPLVE
ncbi:MAG TPA: hypothetical protein VLC95_19040 [Anaerolineae bacterium]|nr:hypothetical protein [Anaerolineae bacterium]